MSDYDDLLHGLDDPHSAFEGRNRSAGRPVNPDSLRQRLERGEAKQLKVVVPDELHHRLSIRAAQERRTMSEIVEALITDYLKSTNKT